MKYPELQAHDTGAAILFSFGLREDPAVGPGPRALALGAGASADIVAALVGKI